VPAEFLKPSVAPDDSALRDGQPMIQCEAGVPRAGAGYGTVVIKKPDGRVRAICFRSGSECYAIRDTVLPGGCQ